MTVNCGICNTQYCRLRFLSTCAYRSNIAEIWVLKSERVLISESIKATTINNFLCMLRVCVRAYPCMWSSTKVAASLYLYNRRNEAVATKLWRCEKNYLELVCQRLSFAEILSTRPLGQRVLIARVLRPHP